MRHHSGAHLRAESYFRWWMRGSWFGFTTGAGSIRSQARFSQSPTRPDVDEDPLLIDRSSSITVALIGDALIEGSTPSGRAALLLCQSSSWCASLRVRLANIRPTPAVAVYLRLGVGKSLQHLLHYKTSVRGVTKGTVIQTRGTHRYRYRYEIGAVRIKVYTQRVSAASGYRAVRCA